MGRLVHTASLVLAFVGSASGSVPIIVSQDGSGDFTEIQPAIDAAEDGCTVLVLPGEYLITEPIRFRGMITVEGAAGPDETIIRMSDTPADGGSVVVFENGETEESVLSGFTLTGGSGRDGGGVYCSGSSPTLVNCRISGNTTRENGGGVYCSSSSPTLTGCAISANFAGGEGGGVCCWGESFPTLTDCTISGNHADDEDGGGVYCGPGSGPTLIDCRISGNSADDDGGGVYCSSSSPTFTNCTILGNLGTSAFDCADSSPTVTGCTIAENSDRGIYCRTSSSLTLTNCVVWGNLGDTMVSSDEQCIPSVSYCCVESDDVWPGAGNMNQDPLFCLPGHWDDSGTPYDSRDDVWVEGDYRLSAASPCLGAGRDGANMGAELGTCEGIQVLFQRGDANADDNADLSDAVFILNYLFTGGPEPPCQRSADCDDNGVLEITDPVRLLNFLFTGGPALDRPFPDCGVDPMEDGLSCGAYPHCQ